MHANELTQALVRSTLRPGGSTKQNLKRHLQLRQVHPMPEDQNQDDTSLDELPRANLIKNREQVLDLIELLMLGKDPRGAHKSSKIH